MPLNLILPCAGSGTRLGLAYPKETHLIAENTALLDLSLRLCEPHRKHIRSVTVVLTPQKVEIARFLDKWRQAFEIRFCYFNDANFEWAGSVLSAEPLFAEKNLVLLHDSYLREQQDYPVVPTMEALLEDHEVAFAHMRESDPERLSTLGALTVAADGHVAAFCDKPEAGQQGFNGFWGAFGFRRAAGRPLLEMMTRSIRREPVDIEALGLDLTSFELRGYDDLGNWPSLHSFIRNFT